jgi:hypothetical protein
MVDAEEVGARWLEDDADLLLLGLIWRRRWAKGGPRKSSFLYCAAAAYEDRGERVRVSFARG